MADKDTTTSSVPLDAEVQKDDSPFPLEKRGREQDDNDGDEEESSSPKPAEKRNKTEGPSSPQTRGPSFPPPQGMMGFPGMMMPGFMPPSMGHTGGNPAAPYGMPPMFMGGFPPFPYAPPSMPPPHTRRGANEGEKKDDNEEEEEEEQQGAGEDGEPQGDNTNNNNNKAPLDENSSSPSGMPHQQQPPPQQQQHPMMPYPPHFNPAFMNPAFFMNPAAFRGGFRPPAHRTGITLSMACDVEQLSDYQILVRQQLELFEASQEDVECNTQGRKKPVVLGQVGLRCRHCAAYPLRSRGRGAVYYPGTLYGIYQAAQNMAGSHLCQACQYIPPQLKQDLRKLRERRDNASGGKQYWADGCRALGLYQDGNSLRLRRPTVEQGPPEGVEQSEVGL